MEIDFYQSCIPTMVMVKCIRGLSRGIFQNGNMKDMYPALFIYICLKKACELMLFFDYNDESCDLHKVLQQGLGHTHHFSQKL